MSGLRRRTAPPVVHRNGANSNRGTLVNNIRPNTVTGPLLRPPLLTPNLTNRLLVNRDRLLAITNSPFRPSTRRPIMTVRRRRSRSLERSNSRLLTPTLASMRRSLLHQQQQGSSSNITTTHRRNSRAAEAISVGNAIQAIAEGIRASSAVGALPRGPKLKNAKKSPSKLSAVSGSSSQVLGSSSGHGSRIRSSALSLKSGKKGGRKRKSHVSFASETDIGNSGENIRKVMMNEKFLKRIFVNLNWNELTVARRVCHKWLNLVGSDAQLQKQSGVICISNRNFGEILRLFNNSLYSWTKFRFRLNATFDLTEPVQSEFWYKHGKAITYLELRNNIMTLANLVDILSKTSELVTLVLAWTPDMYSFNSDIIRKYYNISFRPSHFPRMEKLVIEQSAFLTDSALLSFLRWCGGSLKSLSLTSPVTPDSNATNTLSPKPRWSFQPIEDFYSRFGYSNNFKTLDFSGSNLSPPDILVLAHSDRITGLVRIRLSHCRISDESLIQFLTKKGGSLEELYIDYTPVSERSFSSYIRTKLSKLKCLNISGTSNFNSLSFLSDFSNLEHFFVSSTPWLTLDMLSKSPTDLTFTLRKLKTLNIGHSENVTVRTSDLNATQSWFLKFSSILNGLVRVDLSSSGRMGTNANFRAISKNMRNLKELHLQGWSELSDEGITGMSYEEINETEEELKRKENWKLKNTPSSSSKNNGTADKKKSLILPNLTKLEVLDLGKCSNLTDVTIEYGLNYLRNLRSLGLDGTHISESGLSSLLAKVVTLDNLSIANCERIRTKEKKIRRADGRVVKIGPISKIT